MNYPLNQILYGPPGTGKTYNTINNALKIIYNCDEDNLIKNIKNDNNLSEEIKKDEENRKALKKAFDHYKKQGQIEFITFHQSYGYEEFVEGIKPLTTSCDEHAQDNKQDISYCIKDGIFKKLCKKASLKADIKNFEQEAIDGQIWKMSLGDISKKVSKQIRKYCFDNDIVSLGFCISNKEFKGENAEQILEEMQKEDENCNNNDAEKTSRFKNEVKKMGERGKKMIKEKYSWEREEEKLFEIYEKLEKEKKFW
jgi:5-methylcytosine-specific restriction protein B